MNHPRIILVEEKNEIPCVAIKINKLGKIDFSPLKREGWNFMASMYIKSIIDHTRMERSLNKTFVASIAKGEDISKQTLFRETVNLAKRLDKQKIHLGNQYMKVMVTTGKTDPLIELSKQKKRLSINIFYRRKFVDELVVNGSKTFVKLTEGE